MALRRTSTHPIHPSRRGDRYVPLEVSSAIIAGNVCDVIGTGQSKSKEKQSKADRCAPTSPLSRWEGMSTRQGAPSIDPPCRDPATRGELDIGWNRTENRRDDTEQFEQWRPPPPATAFQPVLPATVYAFIRNTLRPENYPWIWIDWAGVIDWFTISSSTTRCLYSPTLLRKFSKYCESWTPQMLCIAKGCHSVTVFHSRQCRIDT